MKYGDVLRFCLKGKGMSVNELAKKCGISRSSLYAYMEDNAKEPTLSRAQAIADALGIPLSAMLEMMRK